MSKGELALPKSFNVSAACLGATTVTCTPHVLSSCTSAQPSPLAAPHTATLGHNVLINYVVLVLVGLSPVS